MTQSSAPVCVITGSASGIGAACALRFAQAGWSVAIGNFDDATRDAASSVEARCREAGAQTLVFDADVGNDTDCRRAVDAVGTRWQRIDALINCAGTTRVIPHNEFEQIDDVEFERVYRVNLIGLYQMTRAAVPLLRESATASRSTSVVNVSSLAGLNGTGSSIAYAASKGAIDSFTIGLAREVATEGIRVNAVAPGLVDTGLHPANGEPGRLQRLMPSIPMQRAGAPREIAEGVLWLLSPAASYTTGAILQIGGGR